MPPDPLPHIAKVPPVVHGAVADDEVLALGLRPEDCIDFSVSSNPLGIAPEVAAAVAAADLARYPPDGAPRLRAAIASMLGVPESHVLVGAGTIDVLWMLTRAFAAAGDVGVVIGPTFGEYARALRLSGAEVIEVQATPPRFDPPIEAAIEAITAARPRLVFVCVPNNPTGRLMPVEAIDRLRRAAPDALIVVDEAYSAFCAEPFAAGALLDCDNVCILRSMTKDHALAGLRLGYALAPRAVVDALDRVRPPWNVSAPAIAAGIAATRALGHVAAARELVLSERAHLRAKLARLGYLVAPGDANFLLVEVGDATATRARLARQGLFVRDASSFGLPAWVRISIQVPAANQRLLQALGSRRSAAR